MSNQEAKLDKQVKEKLEYWKKECRQEVVRPDWDYYFLTLAHECSKRSHDSQTAHGCVLTTQDHQIISTGYNGFPRSIDDSVLPNLRPEKYDWMIHSEMNSLLDCVYQGKSAKNGIMYVTGRPCFNCTMMMWQAGVKEVVYGNQNSNMLDNEEYEIKMSILLGLIAGRMILREIK